MVISAGAEETGPIGSAPDAGGGEHHVAVSASLALPMEFPSALPRAEAPNVQTAPDVVPTVIASTDFDEFYAANVDRLTDVLTATLLNRTVAEDAAHEAMVRACERWVKVQHYRNPFGWCYRVGLNWSTSRWRKRRREVTTATFSDNATVASVELSDPSVVAALLKLPIDQRSVVVLRLWLDWSARDTAETLDIAEGTVHSRLSRALDRLRAELGTTMEEQRS